MILAMGRHAHHRDAIEPSDQTTLERLDIYIAMMQRTGLDRLWFVRHVASQVDIVFV